MVTVVTHTDGDGVLCLATFMKAASQNCEVHFSSPSILPRTLQRIRAEMLYIFDISGTKESVLEASKSERVLWIDHHSWDDVIRPENIEFHIDNSAKSACSLVSKYFCISAFERIADEIDTNSVISEEADKIRKIVAYYRGSRLGMEAAFLNFSRALASRGLAAIEDYKKEIATYEQKLRVFEDLVMKRVKIRKIDGLKVAVLRTREGIPVYVACNKLREHKEAPFDIILVASKVSGRVELRTHTNFEVLRIAKIFGGGGHKVASGARVEVEDVLTAISLLKY
jgi:oligoribonuclease NrnB/cAMP/cGMP phosphodiesterase (DHH superfamily)